ncbi:hypothetical protein FRX31_013809 [Thalictrum thalictroides]|uniref:Squalene monooxygenase n=1 Tax=Thalictrum thalictroides TaxID=46969 RepID=A0A7J6WGN9_THATH|nr:hypothetical protein FRX31_013809 [Thalictrum thalictroides]
MDVEVGPSSVRLKRGIVTSLLQQNRIVKVVLFKTYGQEHTTYDPLTILCDGCFSNCRSTKEFPSINLSTTLYSSPLPGYSLNLYYIKILDQSFFREIVFEELQTCNTSLTK